MKRGIRCFFLILAIALLLSRFSTETRAAEADNNGFCGVDLTWSYDGEGTLTISGNGDMYHYSSTYALPWDGLTLRKVVIEDGVTSIGSLAFYGRTRLTSVSIPDSVVSIGERAFSYSGLTEITIPDSVTSLGDSVFSECSKLQSVTIGKGLNGIGKNAFYNCSSLTEITIPNKVTSIGEKAFWNCDALTTVVIGDGVTDIGQRAFEDCAALYSVTMGSNVQSIGWCAFYNCKMLASITIPNTVTSIAGYSFAGCSGLTSVYIDDAAAAIGQDAFTDCASLTTATLGSRVTEIGTRAFYNCGKLKSIAIPDTVTWIGSDVLSGCGSLESVTVPFVGSTKEATLTSYSDTFGYFFGVDSYSGSIGIGQRYKDTVETRTYYIPRLLRSVAVTGGKIPAGAFANFTWVRFVSLGDGVTGIGASAFYGCKALTGIVIPDSVTGIESGAFYSCDSLTTAVIGNGVTEIGYQAFDHCGNLKSVSIGNSVETIGSYAFSTCTSLTSVTIPDSVTDIYGGAFWGCRALTSVTLGEGLITIGSEAFKNCSSLMLITIPDKVIAVGDEALNGCDSLLSVTVGRDVTSIGKKVFDNCASLSHVLYRGTQDQWDRYMGIRFLRATFHPDATGDEVVRHETEFGVYCCCTVCEKMLWNDGQVLAVEIQSLPEKLEYLGNRDGLDLTGGVVLVRMADGRTVTKSMTELEVSGFDNTIAGDCLLTLTVVDKTKTFSVKITTATVTFLDHDGTVIAQDEYMYGDTVKVPANPIGREENGQTYTFSGWDKPVTAVEEDTVYTAVYSAEKIPYTVEFVDHEGNVLSSGIYHYGDKVKVPEVPSRDPDRIGHYAFSGWTPEITECLGNAVYTACYQVVDHDYSMGQVTPPTCTKQGYTTFICQCGNSYVGDYVEAVGHSMGQWYETVPSSCTSSGLARRECENCRYFETQKTNEKSHSYDGVVTVPTCTEEGFTTYTCACGHSYVADEVAALGHDVVVDGGKEASCTENGLTGGSHCGRCGEVLVKQETVPAVGHSWGQWVETVKPDASNDGVNTRMCTACGETETEAVDNNIFTDVKKDRFEDAILWAYYNNITTGTGDGTTFSPENACTRKQIVTFLWRAAGEPEPKSMENPFVDVKHDRFEKAILWAYYEGITTGTGDGSTFSPENTCTRKQIVTFLWRYNDEPAPKSTENKFVDVKNDRFASAILWAAEQGITTGTGDGTTFSPEDPCTRKQIVTFLFRNIA